MDPSISVIIPNYNRACIIGRAIDSVLSQTLPATEIIVVDDGSSDESKAFLKKNYPAVRLLERSHGGVSAARNSGIREAKGEWLALLDSDDEWHANKLETQYRALMEKPDYRVVHCNEIWVKNGKPVQQMKKHRKYGGNIFQHCLPLCVISPSSIIIHREVIRETGYFKEDMPVCEDYDMWLRICCRFPVLFIDQALITKHGGHDDQLSQQYWGMDRYRIRALADILDKGDLKEIDRDAAIKVLLKKITIYVDGAKKHGNNEHVNEFMQLQKTYQKNTGPGSRQVIPV